MANLATTDYTVTDSWEEADRVGRLKRLVKEITITTGTAGGGTNKILASTLGFSEIQEVILRGVDNADPGNYLFMPTYDGSEIIAINLEQGTDANRGDPADVAFATFNTKLIIKGKRA